MTFVSSPDVILCGLNSKQQLTTLFGNVLTEVESGRGKENVYPSILLEQVRAGGSRILRECSRGIGKMYLFENGGVGLLVRIEIARSWRKLCRLVRVRNSFF